MIAYLLFFMLAGFPALFYWRKHLNVGWAAVWFLYVLFIGLRHEVGGDWPGYMVITQRIATLSFMDALQDQEPLFGALTWVSTHLGFGVYGANVVGAAIFCTGLFAYCARQSNRWLALAAATPFLVVVAVMSANRQGVAIGVVLFVMSRWTQWNLLQRSAGFVLAAMFHASAVFMLVLTVVDLQISRVKKVFLMLLVLGIGYWLLTKSEQAYSRYTTIYVQQPAGVYAPGALFHLFLNLGPAILMLLQQRRWSQVLPNWGLLRQLCWMAIGLLALAPFFSVAVSRMSLYLFPLSITFISTYPDLLQEKSAKALVRTVFVFGLGSVLGIWLAFANTAFTYLPYKNALLIPASELSLQ